MIAHRATFRWTSERLARPLPKGRRYINPALLAPVPPPWTDGQAWTLGCALDEQPTANAPEAGASVILMMPGAPVEWLQAGVTLYLFEGPLLSAEVTLTGETREVPALGWRLLIAPDVTTDGMALELYDVDDRLQAELYRSDQEYWVALTTYRELPAELLAWVEREGGRILGPFEDGTPPPGPSEWRRSAA